MMGHRSKLKGDMEYDAFTTWRKAYNWKAGVLKYTKRKHNKRVRQLAKRELYGASLNE